MSLFTSSSRYRNRPWPFILGLAGFILINLGVATLPHGTVRLEFETNLTRVEEDGSDAKVFVFGDSRSAIFEEKYFVAKTLNLSAVSNTITYSKLLLERIYKLTDARPKIIFLMLGAHNYSRNSIFTRRDYAITQVASVRDIVNFSMLEGGMQYAIDGLMGKIFPVYGRRMEIRSPRGMIAQILNRGSRNEPNIMHTKKTGKQISSRKYEEQVKTVFTPIARRDEFDNNYYLTYKRSVYSNFQISRMHSTLLETVIELARTHGAHVFLVQLPIERKLLDLQKIMIGNKFDNYLNHLEKIENVSRLDLREFTKYEFGDINHLSDRGSYNLTKEVLNPIISAI